LTGSIKTIKVKIYTSGYRVIKQITKTGDYVSGYNKIEIENRYLMNLANGTYYLIVSAINNSGKQTSGKPVVLLVIK